MLTLKKKKIHIKEKNEKKCTVYKINKNTNLEIIYNIYINLLKQLTRRRDEKEAAVFHIIRKNDLFCCCCSLRYILNCINVIAMLVTNCSLPVCAHKMKA